MFLTSISPLRILLTGLLWLTVLSATAEPVVPEAIPEEAFKTTQVMREETRELVKYLERVHYAGIPVSDLDLGEFIKTYMSDLDHQRLFFFETDLEDFKQRFESMMDIYLHQGTLMPAFEIFKVYRERSLERIAWILKRLNEDFDFSEDETYTPDRSETSWPVNPEEANALWKRRLKYEIIIEMLGQASTEDEPSNAENTEVSTEEVSSLPANPLAKLNAARATVRKRYEQMMRNVEQIEPIEVQEMFLTSLTHMYDPHSTFFSADSLEDFAIAIKNSLVGIGAILSTEDGYCTIKELIPGGPADTGNELEPEDRIVGVAQGDEEMVDVIGMKLRKIVKLIRGKEGTCVRLLIEPANGDPSNRKEITIVRDQIKLTATLAQAQIYQVPHGDKTYSIGVIELPAFYGGEDGEHASTTTHDVAELIGKLKQAGIQGLVLDLRNNGGGLLSEAVSLTGLFIPTGPVVQVKNTIGHIDEHSDTDKGVAWDGPLIVLVSRFSASASEIVTGALKNHHRALIVGDRTTHGKGTVQAVFEIDHFTHPSFFQRNAPKRGAAKVTVQKWYLPNGNSTQLKGVSADIPLPSVREFLPIGEDDLPHALIWDSIAPLSDYDANALSKDANLSAYLITDQLVEGLGEASQQRQHTLPEFNYWQTEVDWFEKKNEQKAFSLDLEKRLKKRLEDKAFQETLDERKEALIADENYPFEDVFLDITLEKKNESLLAHPDDQDEEDDKDHLDIHLREALRIMTDWLEETPLATPTSPQLASKEQA